MHPNRARLTLPLLALTTVAATLSTVAGDAQPASASPHHGVGLTLHTRATLAPPEILDLTSDRRDISQVAGDPKKGEHGRETTTSVTHELQAEVLFAKDTAQLSTAARERFAAIARAISEPSPARVHVSGFTDNLGSAAHALAPPRQRAAAVNAVLADQLYGLGVTFETLGQGEQHRSLPTTPRQADRGTGGSKYPAPADQVMTPPESGRPPQFAAETSELTRVHVDIRHSEWPGTPQVVRVKSNITLGS